MKITVYNLKGGVGKTDIALNLALTLDCGIITNEPFSPFEKVLEDDRFIKLEHSEELDVLPDGYNIIFDFGGYVDKRVISALKQSQCVIVPVVNEFKDVYTTINFLQEIEDYNEKIVVVINKTRRNDFEEAKKVFNEHYPDYPVIEIKYSRAFPNIMKEKKSIKAMVESGGLMAYSYRAVAKQFDTLIQTIKGIIS